MICCRSSDVPELNVLMRLDALDERLGYTEVLCEFSKFLGPVSYAIDKSG